jgi:hypothetical protein
MGEQQLVQILAKELPLLLTENLNQLRLSPNFYLDIYPTDNHGIFGVRLIN